MEDAGGIFTVIHISTDHLLSDHCVLDPPPLTHMFTATTSIQLPSTPIISTHPLSRAVTSAPHTSPHSPLKLTRSMEDASEIFIVIYISSDHFLSDHIALDPRLSCPQPPHPRNCRPHQSHPHILYSQQSHPHLTYPRQQHCFFLPLPRYLPLKLRCRQQKSLLCPFLIYLGMSLLVRGTEDAASMTEAAHNFISVHLHYRDPSASMSEIICEKSGNRE